MWRSGSHYGKATISRDSAVHGVHVLYNVHVPVNQRLHLPNTL